MLRPMFGRPLRSRQLYDRREVHEVGPVPCCVAKSTDATNKAHGTLPVTDRHGSRVDPSEPFRVTVRHVAERDKLVT